MLSHVSIKVMDLEASVKFFLAALTPLGYGEMRFPEVVGMGAKTEGKISLPDFWLRQYSVDAANHNREKPTPIHISFHATDRKQVDEFHKLGLEAGGKDNGKPGLRPYIEGYYAAYLLDLDGNNIEMTCFGQVV